MRMVECPRLNRLFQCALSVLSVAIFLIIGAAAARQSGSLTRITIASDSVRESFHPMVSADGTRVVFYSDSDFSGQTIPDDQNEIWLYDHNTIALTRLTTASDSDRDSFSLSISANGSKIVFQSDSDFLGQGIPDNQVEIWLYDTTTLTLTRLTTATGTDRGSFVPSLNADGTRIAFVSDADFLGEGIPNNQFEIWLLDMNTNDLTRLTTASASDRRSSTPSKGKLGELPRPLSWRQSRGYPRAGWRRFRAA